jgi:hypothetical protein
MVWRSIVAFQLIKMYIFFLHNSADYTMPEGSFAYFIATPPSIDQLSLSAACARKMKYLMML